MSPKIVDIPHVKLTVQINGHNLYRVMHAASGRIYCITSGVIPTPATDDNILRAATSALHTVCATGRYVRPKNFGKPRAETTLYISVGFAVSLGLIQPHKAPSVFSPV